ncbi:M20/M25/M40 family metallo-hydrolase [Pontibacter chitinilyticus]|uniref:M20/M25/M40 family metallo-hydrolase n=1 Tax=Pontibacter chitinilyticus TaxID=2674989 RepID=UPI003219D4BE
MYKKGLVLAAAALSIYTTAAAQKLRPITQQETTRIIKTLSADAMRGRASFSPDIDRAAAFIAGEFSRIGLKPLPGDNDFLQTFTVYSLTPEAKEGQLNGKPLAPKQFFSATNKKELHWQAGTNRKVVVVGSQDNFRKVLGSLQKADQDALVLVNPEHQKIFNAYQDYVSSGSVSIGSDKRPDLVFVLTDQPQAGSYSFDIQNKIEEKQLTNVTGMIEGKRKDEIVVFSGHYDHLGIIKPEAGDSIANGADDDASGTTAMMMLAEYYKKHTKPERTLIFVAFTAEEIGGYGSRYFSEQLAPDKIVAMFNIEMVGMPSKFGPNNAYITGYDKSDMGQLLQKRLAGTAYSIHPDPYPEQNLFYRSDNATLARLGVPAHTISSVQIDKDKLYHSVDDELASLDMAHLTNMIKAIALASQGIVNGEDTPTRVDKTQVQ